MVVNGCNAFERAYQLVTSSETARHDAPYPEGVTANYEYYDGKKAALGRETGLNFSFAPLAAEFVSPNQSTDQLYSFPAGAYSTVDWLLDRIYNNDTRLTVLLGAEVLTVNPRLDTPNDRRIDSITVRQKETVGEIRTTSAKAVILCAGTVDTAHIAIRSGMQKNDHSNVGKGLTDHSIWGTRFKIVPDQGESLSPLKLQAWWDLPSASPSCSCACEGTCDESCRCTRTEHRCDCGCGRPRCCCLNSCQGMQPRKNRQMEEVRCEGDPVLINICVNANTFLGHSLERMFPLQCLNQRGQSLPQERTENTRTNTVNVTFEFASKLEDKNRVLNKGQPAPVLDISESDENSGCYEAMKHMTRNIMKALQPELFNGRSSVDERRIRLSRAEFGAVAHEVGTMRMGTQDDAAAVVDENLKVKDWKGLYVCDLSVFPASPAANPSLTLVALAMRLANYLVEKSG
ncbi:hypothetical protein BDV27DRAFT_158418 [Aspergillus caelatus]|uniref:GMC oxidoreductase-domain-containing protein n=1 Tax=Aspergillus caelatus TaxID=61420 RepID=A0A5N7A1V7_9EURO|nr:uncharacterized protein BDV27DRAFT_158418 [Aspergillus caelatus]KAE8363802.1 hypothetical protein BDV27DRAFT_158418 [Aspergillus caelatus]